MFTRMPHGTTERERLAQACENLGRRLRSGEAARAEDYFASDPPLAAHPDTALELIYAEYMIRGELGQRPSAEQYCARFPAWQADLRDLFQIHEMMAESLADGSPDGLPGGLLADPEHWAPAALPCTLGHFELLEEIGRGAMGVVYEARDMTLDRLVAMKLVRADLDPARFRAEAEAVARLQHPNIVQIYEIYEIAGRSFLSLELVVGGSLKQELARGPLPPRRAAVLLEAVSQAMAETHRRGVVHHDLKPANILLTADGVPKVADFGMAARLTQAGPADPAGPGPRAGPSRADAALRGTPAYMAPELFQDAAGRVEPLVDIYALGAILYEALTGRPPRGATPCLKSLLENATAVAEPILPSRIRPEVPRDLDAICAKCLQVDPAGRYPDAAALAEDLGRYLAGLPVSARPIGTWERAWKWAHRRPTAAALAVVTAVATLSLLAGSLWFNALLSAEAQRAEFHRAEAVRGAGRLRAQLEASRRSLYALQLNHVEVNLERNPGLGLALLNDVRYCPRDLREFTWAYFLRLCSRKRVDLRQHHLGPVRSLAYSPDGRTLAIGSASPAGSRHPGQVKLINPATEEEQGILEETVGPVLCLAYAPDGHMLATASGSGSDDPAGALRVWDLATGKERLRLAGHTQPVRAVAFRPDGVLLASASEDQTVKLWEAGSGCLKSTLRGHAGAVLAVAFAPDGKTLATGGEDGEVRLWDVRSGTGQGSVGRHAAGVLSLAFSPDGRRLASAGADRLAILWELSGRHGSLELKGHLEAVRSLAFSRDGETLVTGGDECVVRLWRVSGGQELTVLNIHEAPVTSIAFAPDGTAFATGSLDRTVKVWDLVPGRQPPPLGGHESKVVAAVFTPDGATLATASRDHTILLRDVASGGVRATLSGHSQAVRCLAAAPDGSLLASGGADGAVILWGLPGGHEVWALRGHTGEITALAFTPDGRRLVSSSLDGTVRVWAPSAGHCLAAFPAHPGGTHGLAISPLGALLATAGEDRCVRLWETAQWRPLAALTGYTVGVTRVAFHPDGATLATGGKDRTIRLWDVATRTERAKLWGHNRWIYGLVYSPDGKTLASATRDAISEVKLWDASSGHVLATFQGRTTPLAFSPDGCSLVTGNHDETINLLQTSPPVPAR